MSQEVVNLPESDVDNTEELPAPVEENVEQVEETQLQSEIATEENEPESELKNEEEDEFLTAEEDEILIQSNPESTLSDPNELHPANYFNSDYFLNKQTESFKCLEQLLFSNSSLLKYTLNYFPPPVDPGIDDAFNYVPPDDVVDDIGAEKYRKICKEFGIVPITRIVKSLDGDTLDLKYYGLTLKQMRALTESLKINGHIRHLILQENCMCPEAAALISDILRENNTIRKLNLIECRIGPEGAEKLAEGLSSTQFLEELDLSFNELGDKGLQALKTSLIENATIKKINLGHNNLTEDSGATMEAILRENKTIEDLNLEWSGFCTGPGNRKLCNGLLKNDAIKVLNLAWNGIGTKQAMFPLMRYIRRTCTLDFLDISNNRLAKESLRMTRAALFNNKSIRAAKAGNCIYTPDEAYYLATSLLSKKNELLDLDMENMCVKKEFLNLLKKITNLDKTVTFGRILSNYEIYGPDVNKLLFNRCKYLAMKPKRKKAKKDFGHFVLSLPDGPLSKADFLAFIKKKKVKKLDKDLLDEVMKKFATKTLNVNCTLIKEAYMTLYPDTVLPEPKKKKKKKKKRRKGGRKGKKAGGGKKKPSTKAKPKK